MRICYVVYHEYERMPIHAVEVIEQLHHQGHGVTVVTAVSPHCLRRLEWTARIAVRQIPILNVSLFRHASFCLSALVWEPFWFVRDRPEVIYERFSLTTLSTLWISRMMGLPLVVEVNGILSDEIALGRSSRWRLWLQEVVERWVFRRCEHLVAVTEGIRQWIHTHHAVPLERITAIANGTNPTRFRPLDKLAARRELGLDPERPIVGYLGSLFPWCGLELLVEVSPAVAAKVPDVLFLIAGAGQEELRAALERRVRELGVQDHFRFFGFIPFDRAAVFINTFDVAVAPARFADARSGISPQKVYAYLACERPVVGSDLKGLGDFLTEEGVGLSFPSGQAGELAAAVVRLLRDPELAAAMGRKGRRVVATRYSWEQVVKRTLTVCAGLIEPRS